MAPKTASMNSARTSAVEKQHVQLVEESSKVNLIGIQEATVTFKGFAAVAAMPAASTDVPSSDGTSTPAAANSVMNDLLQLLVNEISSIRHTLEGLLQDVRNTNKIVVNGLSSMGPTLKCLSHDVEKSNKLLALLRWDGNFGSRSFEVDRAFNPWYQDGESVRSFVGTVLQRIDSP